MTKHPYSTTHYNCGCHIIEDEFNKVNLVKSIYCGDEDVEQMDRCEYEPVLTLRRLQLGREVC